MSKMADDEGGASIEAEEMEIDKDSEEEDEESDDGSEEEVLYEVDKIIGMRSKGNGKKLFKVRWKGYSAMHDTWEPVENLESCLDMVEDYQHQAEMLKKHRSEERKKRMALMAGTVIPDEPSTDEDSAAPSPNVDASGSTLKDTFWKDLEEGRINLFTTDMYSRVKGECRAARPVSFKDPSASKSSSKDENENEKSEDKQTLGSSTEKHLKRQLDKNSVEKKNKHIKVKSRKKLRCRIKSNEFIMLSSSDSSCSENEDSSANVQNTDCKNSKYLVTNNNNEKAISIRYDASNNCYDESTKSTSSCDISHVESMDISNVDSTDLSNVESLDVSVPEFASISDQLEVKPRVKIYEDLKKSHPDISSRPDNADKLSSHKSLDKCVNLNSNITSHHRSHKKNTKHHDRSTEDSRVDKSVKYDSNKHQHRKRSASDKESHKLQILSESVAKTLTKSSSGKENISTDVSKASTVTSGISQLLASVAKTKSSTSGHKDEKQSPSQLNSASVLADYKNASKVTRRKDSSEISQPLEKILSGSLLPILPDNKSQDKVFDLGFDIELDDIDLDELEQQLIHSPGALHLTDDELKQAVIGGDYNLMKRAFEADSFYDIEQPDDNGTTLLMHAIFKNYDDIAEVLICNGAKINAQQKQGNTALITACEQAHICTVALLVEMGANVNLENCAGETPLMKAVKRGHKQIVCYLLESGANFASLTETGYSALTFAKLLRASDVEDIIVDHISRLTSEFEHQVSLTLNNTATIISALFPLQCFSLCDDKQFTISFKNEAEPLTPGVGFLLFIAHAKFSSADVKCRLYGNCAVTAVVLNGIKQPSLTENANFVLSCHPLLRGKNELVIHTEKESISKAKLVVCAYKAQLLDVA